MRDYRAKNAVLLIAFNRLDTLQKTFAKICAANPPRLYLAVDGARAGKIDENGVSESGKVAAVREFLMRNLPPNCEVFTRFNEANLGCKRNVSSAISWFFEREEMGIILEDDCLPALGFFAFCDELLERYKNEPRIFMISGWSALDFDPIAKIRLLDSYFFSKFNHIWGWASWRRAWAKYELENPAWERDFAALSFDSERERREWERTFRAYFGGGIDTWDYPWTFSIWKNGGLCVYPRENMIDNIGFDRSDATHTSGESKYQNMRTYEPHFPLKHPAIIERNAWLDGRNYRIIRQPSRFARILTLPFRAVRKIWRISRRAWQKRQKRRARGG